MQINWTSVSFKFFLLFFGLMQFFFCLFCTYYFAQRSSIISPSAFLLTIGFVWNSYQYNTAFVCQDEAACKTYLLHKGSRILIMTIEITADMFFCMKLLSNVVVLNYEEGIGELNKQNNLSSNLPLSIIPIMSLSEWDQQKKKEKTYHLTDTLWYLVPGKCFLLRLLFHE